MLLTPLTPRFLCALLAGSLLVFSAALAGAEGKQWTFLEQASIDLRDGDRIVILGNAFWERELRDGYLETALTIASSGRSLSFRNLGFSGDTVFGDSWTYSTSHSEETNVRNRLFQLVRDQRPTVIIVNYGAVESFAGPADLDRWSTGVKQLLDEISTTDVRIIIMPPAPFEDLGPPLPDAAFNNKRRNTYVDVLASISHERELDATVFQLEDGRVVSGVVVKQSNQAIAIRNGQNEIVTILPDQVEERSASSVSLMPSGLMNSLRRDELIDLVRYLSELGRTERTREEPE